MPNPEYEPGSPAEWLAYARSDWELARVAQPSNVMREMLCFHAQQAAEKAMKAVLIQANVDFPRTHNLRNLLDKISSEMDLPTAVEDAAILTDYAVSARYPGNVEQVTEEEYEEALRLAQNVLDWAKGIVEQK